MSLREAAQQALLALEFAYGFDIPHLDEHLDALDDIRTALAEPDRKPLTDEEIELLAVKHAPPIDPAFARDDDFIEWIGGEA